MVEEVWAWGGGVLTPCYFFALKPRCAEEGKR